MGSSVLDGGGTVNINELCFQAAKSSDMIHVELQRCLYVDCQALRFQGRNLQIFAVTSCKRIDILMFPNSGFRVRNVEISAVLSSKEVDLLMLRKSDFRQRNDQKCAVQS